MNRPGPRVAFGLGLMLSILICSASSAFAQSQGTVTADRAVIWRTDAVVPATTVSAGVVLDITAQSGTWYVVFIPERLGGHGELGLISMSQVS
jgi:hypothetical protein